MRARGQQYAFLRFVATRSSPARRNLHDRGVYGYQAPREFVLPDFTSEEVR